MASDAVIDLVRRYLSLLRQEGFRVQKAVMFGSQARDEADVNSDIDLLIASPDFDGLTWKQEERIWSLTARLDSRTMGRLPWHLRSRQGKCDVLRKAAHCGRPIEPIPCGESHWWSDEVSPLLEAVRLEGVVIDVDPRVPPYPAREEFAEHRRLV